MKTTIPHGDATTLPRFDWSKWPGELDGPQGAGKLYRARIEDSGRIAWIHETPRGWQRPVGYKFNPSADTIPPLTQTPIPKPVGKCSCGEYHRCSDCGEQTWIEIHGVADGYCTFCHYAG